MGAFDYWVKLLPAFSLLRIVYKTFDQTEVVRVETGAWALEWK